ncbi:MAG: hypothetical protein LC624_04810 [Halobacteriales archaeon]|nr:hypothetical protein [Halobacteriales archaeon]
MDWLAWAFTFKVDPGRAPGRDAREAWRASARAILETVPVALCHAGLDSLAEYARHDTWLDNVAYRLHAGRVPGARRWAAHPTGRVRAATLALLADRVAGQGSMDPFGTLVDVPSAASQVVPLLAGLRSVTSQ